VKAGSKTQHFRWLFVILAVSILIVTTVSIAVLYDTAFTQHRLRLVETVQSQARLIESIARFDAELSDENHPGGWQPATLSKVIDAHRQFEGFGDSGEFTLARRRGPTIVFLLSHRHFDLDTPKPVPFASDLAEPMRLALSGTPGTVIGLDYRGEQVLAAYEYIELLDLGLVAKIDLAEIRAPYIRTGFNAAAVAMLVVFVTGVVFVRITTPIARQIEQQEQTFHSLARSAQEGIVLIDRHGIIQFANPAMNSLLGYADEELPGKNISMLVPSPHREQHDRYIKRYLRTGVSQIVGTKRQLVAQHKNGAHIPVDLSVSEILLNHAHLFTGIVTDLTVQRELQREVLAIPEREQRRIGQELHDNLGQQLTGLGLLAKSLLGKVGQSEYELAEKLGSGLQVALAQVRDLSRGLVPMQIDAQGFNVALRNLGEEIGRQSKITVTLDVNSEVLVSDNTMAMQLYRIAQEALNNAVKHAGAQHITVSLKPEYNRGVLEVLDDGRGVPARFDRSSGIGLRIMKYRCGLFEGEISIEPGDRGGTLLRCRFPLDARTQES